MRLQNRGIVTSIKGGHCIVVTPEGTYERIRLPHRGVQVGEEVAYSRAQVPAGLRPLLLAASFLLVFVSSVWLHQAAVNPVAAYVTLDINPSLEIAVDRNLVVLEVEPLNEDAARLVKPEELKGRNLYEAISGVIDRAVEQNYIKPGEENLIVSTVSAADDGLSPVVDQQAVCRTVERSAASRGRKVQIKMYVASKEIRQQAKKTGISPGKYLVYEQLNRSGKPVSIDEIKKNSVKELIRKYKADLPPNGRELIPEKMNPGHKPQAAGDDNGRRPMRDLIKEQIKNWRNKPESTEKAKNHENRIPGNNAHIRTHQKKSE